MMENFKQSSQEKPSFMGGFGFMIVVVIAVITILIAIKALIH